MTGSGTGGIERRLERFIVDELLEEGYDGRDPLETGAVDSLGVEQLVSYIAEEWTVELSDGDMIVENFESIPALAALVGAKRQASSEGP